jgi:hypothetical protein
LEKKNENSSYVGFEYGRVGIGLVPTFTEGPKKSPVLPSVESLVDDMEKVYRQPIG